MSAILISTRALPITAYGCSTTLRPGRFTWGTVCLTFTTTNGQIDLSLIVIVLSLSVFAYSNANCSNANNSKHHEQHYYRGFRITSQ